ncbi:MAG: PqqD family protein [Coriobacteriales bacterium]|jgi:hypothetical protein|nr:PqqD family protein [Coriobacteriales bacterium]
MAGYRLADGVMMQRNARVPKGGSVRDMVEAALAGDGPDGTPDASGTAPDTTPGTAVAAAAPAPLDPDAVYVALSSGGRHHVLNLSAAFILEALLAGEAPAAIEGQLTRAFDVSGEQAALDIKATVRSLVADGFIVLRD